MQGHSQLCLLHCPPSLTFLFKGTGYLPIKARQVFGLESSVPARVPNLWQVTAGKLKKLLSGL